MNHADHVALLEGEPGIRSSAGIPLRGTGGIWADLGAGDGAFTLALAELLGAGATIHAIDRDRSVLAHLEVAMRSSFSGTRLIPHAADFTHPLDLPLLDGIVMANSLHFIQHPSKPAVLSRLRGYIRTGGQLILVEYNVDRGNSWVPYPLSFPTWQRLAESVGYTKITRLNFHPSRFLTGIFSAVAIPAEGRF